MKFPWKLIFGQATKRNLLKFISKSINAAPHTRLPLLAVDRKIYDANNNKIISSIWANVLGVQ